MTQLHLPIFPSGATEISAGLSFSRTDETVTYFHYDMPIYTHSKDERASFRFVSALLHVTCGAKQADIARAFGIPKINIKRAVKLYRASGTAGFFEPRTTRGAAVLTEPVLAQAQSHLDCGLSPRDVAAQMEIKADTLIKAIRAARLHVPQKKNTQTAVAPTQGDVTELIDLTQQGAPTSKSERSEQDSTAPMGRGAVNVTQRIAASLGQANAVAPQFQHALDVPCAGVLFALPALLALGLLDTAHESLNPLPKGYYGLDSILLLLALMALARMQSVESLRYKAPGEWGKLLGLDRIPEVRTLRAKMDLLCANGKAAQWSADLSKGWMHDTPEQAGVLYVDGHTRVYNGSQTQLPHHYVARQKLCLRATVDFWVNAMDGQPFFAVNKAVDPGLIKVIEDDIVPRLLKEVPNQPSQAQLDAQPLLHRFMLVFDREGYSPDFWSRLKAKRVAILSYNKFPKQDWDDSEFSEHQVTLVNGQIVTMRLAERGTRLSNGLWLREVRKLGRQGHQTSILSTNYMMDLIALAVHMFARWSQENYLKYTREHYNLDRLAGYATQEITDPIEVVNPLYRKLDGEVRSANGRLSRALALFGALNIEQTIEPAQMEAFTQKKASLKEDIDALQAQVVALKATRKETDRHIAIKDLPEDQRFKQLSTHSKHFVDAIKMVAYRAETAMANFLRESLTRPDEARTLLCSIYKTEADLVPDYQNKTLTVRLHHLAQQRSDDAAALLCAELNETQTVFPRTDLRMIFELGNTKTPVKVSVSVEVGTSQNP